MFQVRWDQISNSIITNCPLILTVKKVGKLVNIWRSYKAYNKCAILGHPVQWKSRLDNCLHWHNTESTTTETGVQWCISQNVCDDVLRSKFAYY